jgi:GGDEF domain-containing protein
MRPLDWLAHYSSTEYAFLLPHTNVDEAARLAEVMQSALSSYVLPPEMQGAHPVIVCGIAGLPDDCQHPGVLLAAAYEAKDKGKQAQSLFTLYRDLTA